MNKLEFSVKLAFSKLSLLYKLYHIYKQSKVIQRYTFLTCGLIFHLNWFNKGFIMKCECFLQQDCTLKKKKNSKYLDNYDEKLQLLNKQHR